MKPGKKQKLLDYLQWECRVAREEEPHVLRFDVFEDPNDDNVIYYYAAYVDEAGFELHKTYPPFKEWAGGLKEECVESNEPIFSGRVDCVLHDCKVMVSTGPANAIANILLTLYSRSDLLNGNIDFLDRSQKRLFARCA